VTSNSPVSRLSEPRTFFQILEEEKSKPPAKKKKYPARKELLICPITGEIRTVVSLHE